MQTDFDDIRPYRDDEVRLVLQRLVREPELLRAVAQFRMPGWSRIAPWLTQQLLSRGLAARTANIDSVRRFQQFLESYFVRMVRGTTDGFTWDGTDTLSATAHLFVGNHRDIAMDSGFMNYALWLSNFDTARIAIGDNLLKRPYTTDLMRLNKSFVVRRSATGVKEMAAAFQLTSRYLQHSIDEGESVWIAQREGRAKDGIDRTEPAIIKMFHMSQRKSGRSFSEVVAGLHIVPIAISYEVDPCGPAKARELHITASEGSYHKPDDEDINAIVMGITGYKGRVHMGFGQELGIGAGVPTSALPAVEWTDAEAVAGEIDRQVHGLFRLWPTHIWAAREVGVPVPDALASGVSQDNPKALAALKTQLAEMPAAHRPFLLDQYANPVRSRLALGLDEAAAAKCSKKI